MKVQFTALLIIVLISMMQCRKASPLSCTAFYLEISDELNAWSNAATAYSLDQSTENCQAYKDAGQDYLNALKRYDNCTFSASDQADYNESLKEAQQSLDDLAC